MDTCYNKITEWHWISYLGSRAMIVRTANVLVAHPAYYYSRFVIIFYYLALHKKHKNKTLLYILWKFPNTDTIHEYSPLE